MASPPLTNREYAYFKVSGNGKCEIISQVLGISPTNQWSEGDINPKNNRPRKFMSWQLESGLDDTKEIDDHITALLNTLNPIKSALKDLSVNYDLCIQCVGYFPATGHGLHLDNAVLQKAAEMGLSFDYDFYYIDDNGHDLDYY